MDERQSGSRGGARPKGQAWGKLVCTDTLASWRLRGEEVLLGVNDGSELVDNVKAPDVRLKIKQVPRPTLSLHPPVPGSCHLLSFSLGQTDHSNSEFKTPQWPRQKTTSPRKTCAQKAQIPLHLPSGEGFTRVAQHRAPPAHTRLPKPYLPPTRHTAHHQCRWGRTSTSKP